MAVIFDGGPTCMSKGQTVAWSKTRQTEPVRTSTMSAVDDRLHFVDGAAFNGCPEKVLSGH